MKVKFPLPPDNSSTPRIVNTPGMNKMTEEFYQELFNIPTMECNRDPYLTQCNQCNHITNEGCGRAKS